MAFDLELYFTGLCLIAADSYENPSKCEVLLVNTTDHNPHRDWLPPTLRPHAPRLIVSTKNFVPAGAKTWEADGLRVSPDGEDCLEFNLEGKDLKLEATTGGRLSFNTTSPALPKPVKRYRSEDRSFYYNLKVPHLDSRIRKLGSTDPGRSNAVIARLELNRGKLSCFDLGRRRGEFMVFDFKTSTGFPAGYLEAGLTPRAIADRLILRINGNANSIRIHDKTAPDLVIGIGPVDPEADRRETVKASLTNLDAEYHPSQEAIFDFLWYYTLFDWKKDRPPSDELAIPWPQVQPDAGRTPSSGTCPPGSG